jgi:HD-GYP domain-containing protein (c-di-GMP phosphodiesterase class II)
MVRFSDIVDGGDKKGKEDSPTSEEQILDEKARMSTTEIMLPKGAAGLWEEMPLEERYGEEVKELYDDLLKRALEVRERVEKDEGITHSPILTLLHRIIDEDLIDALYEYAMSAPGDDELPSHSLCVTFASLKVAKGMGYDTKELLRLGLAAFLENVGMYRIPDAILNKEERLTSGDLEVIRKHPETSRQILSRMGDVFQWVAVVASQIHERSDGTGYPKGLKGEEILEAASVIGLIDTYMAMIRNRPYREKYIQTEAVKSILELSRGKFPGRVVKEFLNHISLFPVNTYVKLNNNSIGRVISTDKRQPLRPSIEILYDGLGHKMEPSKRISLAGAPLLHIVDTIDERDLP